MKNRCAPFVATAMSFKFSISIYTCHSKTFENCVFRTVFNALSTFYILFSGKISSNAHQQPIPSIVYVRMCALNFGLFSFSFNDCDFHRHRCRHHHHHVCKSIHKSFAKQIEIHPCSPEDLIFKHWILAFRILITGTWSCALIRN